MTDEGKIDHFSGPQTMHYFFLLLMTVNNTNSCKIIFLVSSIIAVSPGLNFIYLIQVKLNNWRKIEVYASLNSGIALIVFS